MGHKKHSKKSKRRESRSPSPKTEECVPQEEQKEPSSENSIANFKINMNSLLQNFCELQESVNTPKKPSPKCLEVRGKLFEIYDAMSAMQLQLEFLEELSEASEDSVDSEDSSEEDEEVEEEEQEREEQVPALESAVRAQESPPSPPQYSAPVPPQQSVDSPRVLRPRAKKVYAPDPPPRRRGRPPKNRGTTNPPDIHMEVTEISPEPQAPAQWTLPGNRRNWSSSDKPLQPMEQSEPEPIAGPSTAPDAYWLRGNGRGNSRRAAEEEEPEEPVKKCRKGKGMKGKGAKNAKRAPSNTSSSTGGQEAQPCAAAEPTAGPSSAQRDDQPLLRALLTATPAAEPPAAVNSSRPIATPHRKLKNDWIRRAIMGADSSSTGQQALPDMLTQLDRAESHSPQNSSDTTETATARVEHMEQVEQAEQGEPEVPSTFMSGRVVSSLDTLAAVACAMEPDLSLIGQSRMEPRNATAVTFESIAAQQQASTSVTETGPYSTSSLTTLAEAACSLEPELSMLRISESPPAGAAPASLEVPKTQPHTFTPATQTVSSFRCYLFASTTTGSSQAQQPRSSVIWSSRTLELPDNSSVQVAEQAGAQRLPFAGAWQERPTAEESRLPAQPADRGWHQPTPHRPRSPIVIEVTSRIDPPMMKTFNPRETRMETFTARNGPRWTRMETFNPRNDPRETSMESLNPRNGERAIRMETFNPMNGPREARIETFNPWNDPREANMETFNPSNGQRETGMDTLNPRNGPRAIRMETFNPRNGPREAVMEIFNPSNGPMETSMENLTPRNGLRPIRMETFDPRNGPMAASMESFNPRNEAPRMQFCWPESPAQMRPAEPMFSGEYASQEEPPLPPPHYEQRWGRQTGYEDGATTHDDWEASFSVVPEESSLHRNGRQITYKEVTNSAAPVAPSQAAGCSHTLRTSELGPGQMTAPDIHHVPNLVPPPNCACVPKLLQKTVEPEQRSGVGHVMPATISPCGLTVSEPSTISPCGATVSEPSVQGVCGRARRGRRPRGRPVRRVCCHHRAMHTAKRSPQPTAQSYAQPAPIARAQSPELPTRHAAPEMLQAQNQEYFPHQAPPHPATQQQRRRPCQKVNQGRHQRAAEYVVGNTTNRQVTLMPIPPEHRVEMLPRELFNPPAFHFVVQKLHWTYLPKIAPVYGDPRQMPDEAEVVPGGAQALRVPRPAHQRRLSHIVAKYSAPQRPPPPFICPVEPPLKHGGHERTNSELIEMADRATNDVAASVAISLSVRRDPLADVSLQHRPPRARRGGEQAANYELPLNLSLGRRDFCCLPGRSSQPTQVVTSATAGPSRLLMEVPQPAEAVTTATAGPSRLFMEIPQPAATGHLQAPVETQQMERMSWSTATSSHQLPSQLPSQLPFRHAEEIYWRSANASHVLPKCGEVATWPTAGPSYGSSQRIVPHTSVSVSQMPSQHVGVVTWPIADNPQVPTQHVAISWSITGMSQVDSQHQKEESWPVIGTSQSRTGTVITSRQLHPQEAGNSQQINKKSLQEWPTEEDFPPPKLSESSDDSSNSSDTINLHRRKQDKGNIVRQNNGY